MTALAKDKVTPRSLGDRFALPVLAATLIYGGSFVVADISGWAKPGSAATNQRAIGVATAQADNSSGANGAINVDIQTGIFRFNNSSSSDEITAADVNANCYIVDDQTVAKTDGGAARSVAGRVVQVDTNGVWVAIGERVETFLGVPTITVGAEAANAINVAIQLNDFAGRALGERGSLVAYLSDDANGDSIAGTAPDGGVAIGTDGLAIPLVANKAFQLVSEADGDIDLDITESSVDTWYLVLVLPDGRLVTSDAITFA